MTRITREQAQAVLNVVTRKQKKLEALRKACFAEQLAFIDDPCKLKAAQCARRSGKSYGGAGIYLCQTALRYPRSTSLYIATTREQARRIIFKDVLWEINKRFDLGLLLNKTTLTVTFPNESIIYIMGLDSKPEEMEKALGQKYRLVIIDEGGSWRQDQRTMVHSVLQPACADYQGTIAMIGSPVPSTRTYFFDITGRADEDPQRPKGWSVHRWSWKNNPHVRRNMQKQIDDMVAANPLVVETPAFRQMYLNQWVRDPSALCYRYDYSRNSVPTLPTGEKFNFALGIDLGFDDPTAIVVSAYSEYDPNMYIVEVFKQKGMDLSAVANVIDLLRAKYNPYKMVVDNASKQAVEELRNRFGFPLEASDKQGKYDIIQIMNNDFVAGRIKLVMPGCKALEDEYVNLVWDKKTLEDPKARIVENSACPNHAADAALYSWRMCYHYAAHSRPYKPRPGSDEAMDEWWDNEAKKLQRKKSDDWLTKEIGHEYYGYH